MLISEKQLARIAVQSKLIFLFETIFCRSRLILLLQKQQRLLFKLVEIRTNHYKDIILCIRFL